MYHKYIVETHLGEYPTVAKSERKALNNVRYRIYGCSPAPWQYDYWKVREVK